MKQAAASMGNARWSEWVCPIAAAFCLIVQVLIVSPHVPMWLDEVYTYYGVKHDSLEGLVQSYKTGFNSIPPLYPFAIWTISRIIPVSVLSLRIYSAICSGVGVCLLWAVLRRHFDWFAATIATLTVCLTSSLFLFHSAEARFYGLYFALVAWAVYNYDRLCSERPGTAQLVVNSFSHALAVSCTYAAGFYSLAILVSLVIRDRVVSLWRPAVYASVLAGWLPLLFYAPIMVGQKGEAGLIGRPHAGAILHTFDLRLDLYFVFCALAGLAVLSGIQQKRQHAPNGGLPTVRFWPSGGTHLIILAFVFLLVPYVLLLITWTAVPVLVGRYVMPSLIGLGVLFAAMFACFSERPCVSSGNRRMRFEIVLDFAGRSFRVLLVLALLLYPVKHAISWVHRVEANKKADPIQKLVESKSIFATSDPHSFFPVYFYSGEAKNIYMIARDREEYKRYRRFNKRLNPITVGDFLKRATEFSVACAYDRSRWFEKDLRSRKGYVIKVKQEWQAESGRKELLSVERGLQ